MQQPVVRVSIIRCAPEKFAELRRMMVDADFVLRAGIEAMPGIINFYAGADEATSSLTNVSIWKTLDNAKQLDTFQPMLDLGKVFVQKGATFERPIMNHLTLWQTARFGVPVMPRFQLQRTRGSSWLQDALPMLPATSALTSRR